MQLPKYHMTCGSIHTVGSEQFKVHDHFFNKHSTLEFINFFCRVQIIIIIIIIAALVLHLGQIKDYLIFPLLKA